MRVRNIVFAILCIVLVGILVILFYADAIKHSEAGDLTDISLAKVNAYEKELESLNRKLTEARQEALVAPVPMMVFTFEVSTPEMVDKMLEFTQKYSLKPAIVLDIDLEDEELQALLSYIDTETYNVAFTGEPFNESCMPRLLELREAVSKTSLKDTGLFILREASYCSANVELLRSNGFAGYTVYTDYARVTNKDGDMYYCDYSYIVQTGTVITERLKYMITGGTTMVMIFDLNAYEQKRFKDNTVRELVEDVYFYRDSGKMVVGNIEDAFEAFENREATEAENLRVFEEEYAADLARKAELERLINEYYYQK
ncbi:MAG: hypothetical protein K6F92_07210 [Lachnospiraceae bacterium]|nr:hypothetical protein [Lachnospiraceae bacterium]